MDKPGLQRAIPMALIGTALGALAVLILRSLQSMDPVWDAEVALVVLPFTTLGFFLWGMGAFNPKMSEHPHGPEDVHEPTDIVPAEQATFASEESTQFGLLTSQVWRVTTVVLLFTLLIFVVALLPLGLNLQTVSQPEGNVAAFETTQTFLLPLGVGEFQASQLTVFLGFIAFTIVSMLLAAAVFWVLVVGLHHNVTEVRQTDQTQFRLPAPDEQSNRTQGILATILNGLVTLLLLPLRLLGLFAGWLARVLKNGLPAFFGMK